MKVPWTKLTHAYGKAKDVPAMLDALRSEDAALRAKARGDLEAALAHQGTLYAATAPAVAAIAELLADARTPGRAALLETFVTLVLGDPERFWAAEYPPDEEVFAQKAVKPWRDAYAAAEGASDTLVALLGDAAAEVRAGAAYALAWLGTKAKALRDPLTAALAREADAGARASMTLALGWLGVETEAPGAVGAIVRAHTRVIREADLAVLGAAVAGSEHVPGWGALAPIAFAHLDAYLGLHKDAVVALWLTIAEQGGPHAEDAKRPAYAFIFGEGRAVKPKALEPDQLRLLRVFVSPEAPDPKALAALAEAGLPKSLAALKKLAGAPPSRWERELTIDGETRTGREHLGKVSIAAAAALPTDDAVELASLWVSAETRKPELVRELIEAIIDSRGPAIEPALRRAAAPIIKDGPARETRNVGVVVHLSIPALLVTMGTLLAERGHLPGPWFDQMITVVAGHAMPQPEVAAALSVLPTERRASPFLLATQFMDARKIRAWAPLVATEPVVTALLERLAGMSEKSSFSPDLGEAIAAFGPLAIGPLEAISARATTHHRDVFAAALQRLRA